jgi:hypothetical protein
MDWENKKSRYRRDEYRYAILIFRVVKQKFDRFRQELDVLTQLAGALSNFRWHNMKQEKFLWTGLRKENFITSMDMNLDMSFSIFALVRKEWIVFDKKNRFELIWNFSIKDRAGQLRPFLTPAQLQLQSFMSRSAPAPLQSEKFLYRLRSSSDLNRKNPLWLRSSSAVHANRSAQTPLQSLKCP